MELLPALSDCSTCCTLTARLTACGLCAEAEEGEAEREHTLVLQYDGPCQTKAFAQLATQACTVAKASNGAVGLGVVSILGFEDTYRHLQARAEMPAADRVADCISQSWQAQCKRTSLQAFLHASQPAHATDWQLQ